MADTNEAPEPPQFVKLRGLDVRSKKKEELDVTGEWAENQLATKGFHLVATTKAVDATSSATAAAGIQVIGIPSDQKMLPQSSAPSKNIISRAEQREVVQYAFETSRQNIESTGVCITLRGSPGIGKSWSAPLYIRTLMTQKENRRPIIYEIGNEPGNSKTYLIYPKKIEMEKGSEDECAVLGSAWTVYVLVAGQRVSMEWMQSNWVDFVIDPPQFPSGVDPKPSMLIGADGHTFIPASTDNRHLGGGPKSFMKIIELVLGPYTMEQLEVAFPFMMYPEPDLVVQHQREKYDADMKHMRRMYKVFGGLPRWLFPTRDGVAFREAQMMKANARRHADLLLRALSEPWTVNTDIKIASLFFTLRPGVDEVGNQSYLRQDSSVEFVSQGAVRAAGAVVYEEIRRRVSARAEEDSSQIGLAFEHVGLMLLCYGTDGLHELGISVRCKELKKEKNENPKKMEFIIFGTPSDRIERSKDSSAYESLLKEVGRSLQISAGTLKSTKGVLRSPTGYSNVDGMCGTDVGIQMTLQKNHSVLGLHLAEQRRKLDLPDSADYALIFVVPPERFDEWNSFQNLSWKTADSDETIDDQAVGKGSGRAAKRPRLLTNSTETIALIDDKKKRQTREKLRQFVVTLDIDTDNLLNVKAGNLINVALQSIPVQKLDSIRRNLPRLWGWLVGRQQEA